MEASQSYQHSRRIVFLTGEAHPRGAEREAITFEHNSTRFACRFILGDDRLQSVNDRLQSVNDRLISVERADSFMSASETAGCTEWKLIPFGTQVCSHNILGVSNLVIMSRTKLMTVAFKSCSVRANFASCQQVKLFTHFGSFWRTSLVRANPAYCQSVKPLRALCRHTHLSSLEDFTSACQSRKIRHLVDERSHNNHLAPGGLQMFLSNRLPTWVLTLSGVLPPERKDIDISYQIRFHSRQSSNNSPSPCHSSKLD